MKRPASNFRPVAVRETMSYFHTPVAWFVIVIFLVVSGIFFLFIMNDYAAFSFDSARAPLGTGVDGPNVAEGILRPLFQSLGFLLLLFIPLITMKSFSEEKRSGVIELLFTYPLRDAELALGKFFAALTVLVSMLAPTFVYCLMVLHFRPLPPGETAAGYLGLLLMGSAFTALGIFISSLTENQIISAAWTFGAIMAFWMADMLAGDSASAFADVLRYISIFRHFESFTSGIVDTRDVIYYISFTAFFIFLTIRTLESRRWRS